MCEKNTLNVLIVDDHPGMRYLLQMLIEEEGHNTVTASNGRKAIELVKKFNFGIVFMDIAMPLMDGFTALER
ncbi:MAG: response regulator [Desulfotomaculum sp.]|nr:response regulator [Desulfotomaculum sp.]